MKAYLNRAAFLGSMLTVLAMSPQLAAAQSVSEGIQIKPAIVDERANPGEQFTFNLNITNVSASQKTFYLSSQDIKGMNDAGVPQFAAEGEKTGYELSSWINLPGGSITLRPGEARGIPFSVDIPNSASPGSHFAAVFLTDSPPKNKFSGSGISIRVGTIVSLRIAGDAQEEARIREFATGKVIYSTPTVDFTARIENLGNVLVRPRGLIEISNMFGKKVDSVAINDEAAAVFPIGQRIFSAVWKSDSFAFGRYQAIASFAYGDDVSKTIFATTSFWVLPFNLIIIVLLSLLGVIVALFVAVKMYIRKKLNEMSGTGKRAGTDYYAQKYQRSGSRLMLIFVGVFLFCVMLLGILFVLFA